MNYKQHILLSSSSNIREFPENTPSNFSNLIPDFEHNEKIFVKIKSISLSKHTTVIIEGEKETPPFIKIHLNELSSHFLQHKTDIILAQFAFNIPPNSSGDYFNQTFDHSPFLSIRTVPLTHLTIYLTDHKDNPLEIDRQFFTFIQIELSGMNEQSQFNLNCMSHFGENIKLFPTNRTNSFRIMLPEETTLTGWEVAVSGISIPPQATINNKITFRVTCPSIEQLEPDTNKVIQHRLLRTKKKKIIQNLSNDEETLAEEFRQLFNRIGKEQEEQEEQENDNSDDDDELLTIETSTIEQERHSAEYYDRTFSYNSFDYISTKELCDAINHDLFKDSFLRGFINFVEYKKDVYGFIVLRFNNFKYHFNIKLNDGFRDFSGFSENTLILVTEETITPPEGSITDISKVKKPNLGLLFCDIVEPSIVGTQKLPLLHMIPFDFNQKFSYYEPNHLMYRPIVTRTFKNIHFEILQPNGKLYEITDEAGEKIAKKEGGINISLLFRPKQ